MSKFRSLYEYQSGGYPMEQVLVLEGEDDGQVVPKVCAFFADAELDVFMVEYGYDGEITLHAEDVTHIATGPSQLQLIASLADQGHALRAEVDSYISNDEWIGHEHLITKPKISNKGAR